MDTTQTSYQNAAPELATTAPEAGATGKFRRSREHKLLGGVCGGIATKFNFDVALVRVIAVILAIVTNGIGALVYLAAWLIIPEEGNDSAPLASALRR
ncbi:MAG: PspC domain-containing protein [Streptosporangiales bacterium]|nr:PspC domain-containing protein [Streptosporangiales bacterium]